MSKGVVIFILLEAVLSRQVITGLTLVPILRMKASFWLWLTLMR